jgi:hypothetical protein
VDDPAAPTVVSSNPTVSRGQISVVPAAVLATQKDRLAVEQIGRDSVGAQDRYSFGTVAAGGVSALTLNALALQNAPQPFPPAVRQVVLQQVDQDLVAAGLLTAVGGSVSDQAKKSFAITVESCLPTPGIIVKGCLDTCDVCEPELQKKIELELAEKDLRNQLLKRQIELLDKAQEYRCCPCKSQPDESK